VVHREMLDLSERMDSREQLEILEIADLLVLLVLKVRVNQSINHKMFEVAKVAQRPLNINRR